MLLFAVHRYIMTVIGATCTLYDRRFIIFTKIVYPEKSILSFFGLSLQTSVGNFHMFVT
jgi:hypothetical protein